MPPWELEHVRRSRRHPKLTQFDYLHLHCLVRDLRAAITRVPGPVDDVLDVWCGSRPYDDLFPSPTRVVGLDVVGNRYGVADVVSDEFLPFEDASFDVVMFLEALQFVPAPAEAVAEMRRVLRPGGTALVGVPFAWEYERTFLERRFTGPELERLFAAWEDVIVRENGGATVVWTVLTAGLLHRLETAVVRGRPLHLLRPLFGSAYAALNVIGLGLAKFEERHPPAAALPMNLLVSARRPAVG
jgi:SAM-dependent methyltransferase